jgi:hypothetical protein
MTVTTTWNINQMDAYPEYEGSTNVVFTVHWSVTATEDEYVGYSYGSVGLTLDPEATFTPFAELTKEQVVGWVHAALGEEQVVAIETSLANQIELQRNPPVVTPPLPWA